MFGPKPHSYDIKLNRKVKDLAKISALSHKAKENAIVVIEDINLDAPKTKTFSGLLDSIKVNNKKVMFVTPDFDENVFLSYRNMLLVNGVVLSDINTYDLMNADVLVMTEGAAKIFTEEEETANA